jgi:hypothetical protein
MKFGTIGAGAVALAVAREALATSLGDNGRGRQNNIPERPSEQATRKLRPPRDWFGGSACGCRAFVWEPLRECGRCK